MYHEVISLSIVTILCALLVLGNAQDDLSIVEHPKNQSNYKGNAAIFQCISYRSDTIVWTVDEDPPQLRNLSAPLLMKGDEKHTRVSRLEVPAEIEYNNSMIFCFAFAYATSKGERSKAALMLVQGPPGKVEKFQGYNNTETSIIFEWEPPFHVEGTVCCLSYYVNVTHVISGDNIFNGNITTTHLNFTLEADRLCDLYVIQIIAYNEVGEGELFEQNWSLGGFFRTDAAKVSLGYSGRDLILDVNVTIGGYCLSQLNNATLYAECPPEEPVQQTNQISALPTDTVTRTNFSVSILCEDGVGTYDIALENSVDKGGIFYTFDVIRADYNVGPGTVCVTCYYITSSPASGCRLVVSNTGVNKDIQVAVNIPQESVEGCVEVASEGFYGVRVFDWNTDESFSEEPAVDFGVISVPPPSIPVPSTTPTVDDPTTRPLESGAIAGITIGVIVAFIAVSVLILVIVVVLVFKLRNKPDSISRDSRGEQNQFKMRVTYASAGEEAPNRPVLYAQINAFLDSWYEDTVKNNSVELSTCEDRENGCVYLKVKHLK